jgi:HEXXH motif-containing protein
MSDILNLVDTNDVLTASRRVLNLKISQLAKPLQEQAATIECHGLRSVLAQLLDLNLLDTPRLWHWTSVSTELLGNLRRADGSFDPARLGHFQVDELRPTRLLELHLWKLVELAIHANLTRQSSFEMQFDSRPPNELCLASLGAISNLDPISASPWTITVDKNRFSLKTASASFELEGSTPQFKPQTGLSWTPGLQMSSGGAAFEIPIHDSALCNPSFCNAPIVQGRRAVSEWLEILERAFSWLCHIDPRLIPKIADLAPAILPLHCSGALFGSASVEDAFGLVFLPAVLDPIDVAECFLHEALHQLLFRIERSVSLINGHDEEIYYSPWRSDARPLRMVLHGAFVFIGVAALYVKAMGADDDHLQGHEAKQRAYLRARQAQSAIETVNRHAVLSPLAKKIVAAVARQATEILEDLHLDEGDRKQIEQELSAHYESVDNYVR